MAKFKKQIIKTGIYRSPDGEVPVTPERIDHWCNQFKRMSINGLKIPIPWGHQQTSPLTYEEREYQESKFNAGFIEEMLKEKDDDGEDMLVAVLDIPLKQDIEKIGTTIKEVSPQIESNFVDGKGKLWQDVITHLALVTLPVIPSQDNFKLVDDPLPANALRLNLKNRLRGIKMADKKCVDKEFLELLKKIGIVLPEDTDDSNFAERMKPAMLTLIEQLDKFDTSMNADGKTGTNEEDLLKGLTDDLTNKDAPGATNPDEMGKNAPKEEVPPTMTLSLRDKEEFDKTKSELENTKQKLSLTGNELESMRKNLESTKQQSMEIEVDSLLKTGRITPVIAQKLTAETKTYKLSLRSDGTEEPTAIRAQIDTFKLMPEGSAWSSNDVTKMRNSGEADLPTSFGGISDEDAEKIAQNQLKVSKGLAIN